jgi:hypothetical protein
LATYVSVANLLSNDVDVLRARMFSNRSCFYVLFILVNLIGGEILFSIRCAVSVVFCHWSVNINFIVVILSVFCVLFCVMCINKPTKCT